MKLRTDEKGKGPAVLLLHGGGGSRMQWHFQLAFLSKKFRTIALDLPGHGESEVHYGDDFVGNLQAFVRTLKVESLALVGHSLGANLCVALAPHLGEAVRQVVLIDPMADVSRAPKDILEPFLLALQENQEETLLKNAEAYFEHATDNTKQLVLSDIRRTQPLVVYDMIRSLTSFDPLKALEKISAPIHCLASPSNQHPFSLDKVMGIEARLIHGVSHWMQLDKPDEINSFLSEVL